MKHSKCRLLSVYLDHQRKTALVGIEQQRLQNPSKKYLIFIETERDLRYNMDG